MAPPAPPTFSMITDCPSGTRMRSPMIRAAVSVEPPGGKGTMSVIGLAGEGCAATTPFKNKGIKKTKRLFMSVGPDVGFFDYAAPLRGVGLDLLDGLRGGDDLRVAAGRVD